MASSGKTTAVDTLYRITKENAKEFEPISDLTKIAMPSGATIYFDRGIFQSHSQKDTKYHVYTVAGQKQYIPLRKRVFKGTEGVIFVVDSQTPHFEDNIESLKQLKHVAQDRLITEIPIIVILNKQDLLNVIHAEDFKRVLKDEGLWYEPPDPLHVWNPIIYETCALFEKKKDIYRSFAECARRANLYKVYGEGKAPIDVELPEVWLNLSLDIIKYSYVKLLVILR